MSEVMYQQVDDAIDKNLHLGCEGNHMSTWGMTWHYPVAIELGDVVMRYSDCGLAKPTLKITIAEWTERVTTYGLWRLVGGWSFVRADDPAARCIKHCHHSPDSAGRELYRLRQLEEATK